MYCSSSVSVYQKLKFGQQLFCASCLDSGGPRNGWELITEFFWIKKLISSLRFASSRIPYWLKYRIQNYNQEFGTIIWKKSKIFSNLKTQASSIFRCSIPHRSTLWQQLWKISIRWELYTCSKKAKFFCTISVGENCRDGSNTLLLTGQQEYQLIGLVVMI